MICAHMAFKTQRTTGNYLNKKQVAQMLGIGMRTLVTWMRLGRLPVIRITKRTIRFDREAVLAHIKATCTVSAKVEVAK
jgi:excisionase family DNA binding protein